MTAMQNPVPRPPARRSDRGMAMPLIIVMVTTISLVVLSLASFAITELKSSRVAADRSDRLSAADAGLRYAIDQLKLRNAGCILDTQVAVLPGVDADFNGASATVTCERVTSGFEGIQAYAAVMTGEGLAASDALLVSQSGSNDKLLGGPVYMSRVDSAAFDLSPPVKIADGPLLYHDTSGDEPCRSIRPSVIDNRTGGKLVFEPELIFGPICVSVGWQELFASPQVPDLSGLVERDGSVALGGATLPGVEGSYTDVAADGGCRVFEPGRYTTPPDLDRGESYFKSGEYLFDFDGEVSVKQGALTAGKVNPITTPDGLNVNPTTSQCRTQQLADPSPEPGATFYFAQRARMRIESNGAIEIHARQQGPGSYVSVQALCDPTAFPAGTPAEEIWCGPTGGGSFPVPKSSALTAPATTTGNLLYTDSGNNKDFVAHALFYAPRAQIEFGNVSNTAVQKMLGGLIVSRLKLQSSTSATNFEISVPTSPITAEILLTSTAVKSGQTSIQTVVQYRPYEPSIDDRLKINSSRVCAKPDCSDGPDLAPSTCLGGDASWTADFYDNISLGGSVDFQLFPNSIDYAWGLASPSGSDTTIPVDGFSARFRRTVDLPSSGTYRFSVGSDDGHRLRVNGVTEIDDWEDQTFSTGTNQVDVDIDDPCSVDIELDYYDRTGQARVVLSWAKVS